MYECVRQERTRETPHHIKSAFVIKVSHTEITHILFPPSDDGRQHEDVAQNRCLSLSLFLSYRVPYDWYHIIDVLAFI